MPAYSVAIEVRFNDIDGMGHVNNALYLTYLEHCRMRFFTEVAGSTSERDFPFILAHAALDYKAPMKINAKPVIKMWTSRIGGKSWDFDYEIKDAKSAVLYATGKTVQVAYDYQLEKSDQLEGRLLELVKGLKP
ncbi:MAG: acyl-CoA thioester hydrolase [Thermoplasmata archaeon]|jgi:acyl-CoA thioester hydrolase|nr:acyl-CoA thioester hydrolase [Thermoplasmata archaeon]